MNFKELYEGVEPKMPGAPKGIQIMTPQQFVAKAGDMPGEESGEQGVAEGSKDPREIWAADTQMLNILLNPDRKQLTDYTPEEISQLQKLAKVLGRARKISSGKFRGQSIGYVLDKLIAQSRLQQRDRGQLPNFSGRATTTADMGQQIALHTNGNYYRSQGTTWTSGKTGQRNRDPNDYIKYNDKNSYNDAWAWVQSKGKKVNYRDNFNHLNTAVQIGIFIVEPNITTSNAFGDNPRTGYGLSVRSAKSLSQPSRRREDITDQQAADLKDIAQTKNNNAMDKMKMLLAMFKGEQDIKQIIDRSKKITLGDKAKLDRIIAGAKNFTDSGEQGVAEGEDHLNRIRKLSGLAEATTLPASTRDLKGQEFQDYMNRIKGTDDIDKKTGQVKLDKKGNEKYVTGKTKGDKYKMPYIHRSSIIEYLGPDGKTYDEDKIKQSLSQRPKALLKQNEKMKHSNGEFEQFFNVGFAALTGIAVDEQTNNLIIVNTCPGAGSCKIDCFAMKGGKVQFKAAWQSDGRILTYLLNDPSGFFNQLSSEISKEESLGKKGDKKFPNGWKTTIRWHDAGDFFSPEYLDLALKMAAKHPDTKFYAYTKMAGAALAQKPPNFIINWSEGANTSQEKQVKAKDANLDTTKNSRIVPDDLFQDLLVKDEKKNLVKGSSGQWQVQPDKLPELKQRLASEYGLSANSILSYDEYMAKRKSIPQGMKYNVIVAPGEGDISANDPNIISTLLLRH